MNISQSLATGQGVTLSEALSMGGLTTVLGLTIVFSVLIILMIILMLFKVIFYKLIAKLEFGGELGIDSLRRGRVSRPFA